MLFKGDFCRHIRQIPCTEGGVQHNIVPMDVRRSGESKAAVRNPELSI